MLFQLQYDNDENCNCFWQGIGPGQGRNVFQAVDDEHSHDGTGKNLREV